MPARVLRAVPAQLAQHNEAARVLTKDDESASPSLSKKLGYLRAVNILTDEGTHWSSGPIVW